MAVAAEADHGLAPVVTVDPFEAAGLEIALVQCRFLPIAEVELIDQGLDALMQRVLEQPPVEFAGMRPLVGLAELRPHEQ